MDHTVEHRTTRMPRGFRYSLLLAGLVIAAVSLSQCRMIDSPTTGVDLTPSTVSGRSVCLRDCNNQYKTARNAEQNRHRAAYRACGSSKSCKKQEKTLHKGNEKALKSQHKECKRGCYNEGAGVGGR